MSDPGPIKPKPDKFNQNVPVPSDGDPDPSKPKTDGYPIQSPFEPVKPHTKSPE